MNKSIYILTAVFTLLSASCNNETTDNNIQEAAPVMVHVNDFSISQEDISGTRATSVSNSTIKVITLAFYNGSTEVYKTTQLKDNTTTYTTFGDFSLSLPMGSYTMVVLGYVLYDDDELTLTSPTEAEYTVNAPRETFAATQEVNITSTEAVNLSATLNRIVAQLKVISSDNRTDNINKVRMTFSKGGKRFSPTSGLATVNTGFSSTVGIGTAVGAKSGSIGYVFLAADQQTMDVKVETLDAQGNAVYSTVVKDVPFQRNRITKLTGAIYSNSSLTASFQIDTAWEDTEEVTF